MTPRDERRYRVVVGDRGDATGTIAASARGTSEDAHEAREIALACFGWARIEVYDRDLGWVRT